MTGPLSAQKNSNWNPFFRLTPPVGDIGVGEPDPAEFGGLLPVLEKLLVRFLSSGR